MKLINHDATFVDFDSREYITEKYVERSGWIYLLRDKAFPGYVKVGKTYNLHSRLNDYNKEKPFPTAELIAVTAKFVDAGEVERQILVHMYTNTQPTTLRKEWFHMEHEQMILKCMTEAEQKFPLLETTPIYPPPDELERQREASQVKETTKVRCP